MAEVAIGQNIVWYPEQRDEFNHIAQFLEKAGIDFVDWENGKPFYLIQGNTPYGEYQEGTQPSINKIPLKIAEGNIKNYNKGITVTLLEMQDKPLHIPTILQNAATDVGNDIGKSYILNILENTIADIDFAGEYSLNNVTWFHRTIPVTAAQQKQIVGLHLDQIDEASYLLDVSAEKVNIDFIGTRHRKVLIAPDVLKRSFLKSDEFRNDTSGIPGAMYNPNFLIETRGITPVFLPTSYFEKLKLTNADIDTHGDKGIYAYLMDSKSVKGITTAGQGQLLPGQRALEIDTKRIGNGDVVGFARWANGCIKAHKETFVRIACRLENTNDA